MVQSSDKIYDPYQQIDPKIFREGLCAREYLHEKKFEAQKRAYIAFAKENNISDEQANQLYEYDSIYTTQRSMMERDYEKDAKKIGMSHQEMNSLESTIKTFNKKHLAIFDEVQKNIDEEYAAKLGIKVEHWHALRATVSYVPPVTIEGKEKEVEAARVQVKAFYKDGNYNIPEGKTLEEAAKDFGQQKRVFRNLMYGGKVVERFPCDGTLTSIAACECYYKARKNHQMPTFDDLEKLNPDQRKLLTSNAGIYLLEKIGKKHQEQLLSFGTNYEGLKKLTAVANFIYKAEASGKIGFKDGKKDITKGKKRSSHIDIQQVLDCDTEKLQKLTESGKFTSIKPSSVKQIANKFREMFSSKSHSAFSNIPTLAVGNVASKTTVEPSPVKR